MEMPKFLSEFLENLDSEPASEVREWLSIHWSNAACLMADVIDNSRTTDETEVTY